MKLRLEFEWNENILLSTCVKLLKNIKCLNLIYVQDGNRFHFLLFCIILDIFFVNGPDEMCFFGLILII